MSYAELVTIQKDLSKNLQETCKLNGLEYLNSIQNKEIKLGIESLDKLLNNTNLSGKIIEFCGSSCAGKTQICSTIALNLSQKYNYETLYIDTKRDFLAKRLLMYLEERNTPKNEIHDILQNIKIERVFSPRSLIQLLTSLYDSFDKFRCLKLIIIDSLPSLWFLLLSRDNVSAIIIETSNLLKNIAQNKQTIIITVNLTIKNFSPAKINVIDDCILDDNIVHVAIGKFWLDIPSHRFLVNGISQNRFDTCRRIKILKSTTLQTGICCIVELTNKGVI